MTEWAVAEVGEGAGRARARRRAPRVLVRGSRRLTALAHPPTALPNHAGVWDAQCKLPKNNVTKVMPTVDPEMCGLACAQKFDGEDRSKGSRIGLQQAQFRSWMGQQMAEKDARAADEKIEDLRYAEYLATVQEARGVLEGEDADARKMATHQMKADNLALAAEAEAKRGAIAAEAALLNAKEIDMMNTNAMLCEDTSVQVSALGAARVRRDHFKGFSKAQTHSIYLENQAVLEEKHQLAEAKRLDDANYAAQGDDLRKLVEEVEYANATSQRELAAQHKAYLMQQREEQAQMRAAEKNEGKGAIMEGGLMSGFGVSWR